MKTPSIRASGSALLAAGLLASPSAPAADEIPRPTDGWMIQGTAYPVLVENLTQLWQDAPPPEAGFTKTCNVRFVMQAGHLTQTSFGKCIGGLEESMQGFLQGMFFWPLDETHAAEPNGAGLNVVLRSQSWGVVPRIEAEDGTPFLELIDGKQVPFQVWSPAVQKSGPQPEPSKKVAKAIGTATCTLSADVDAYGVPSNLAVLDCPEAAQKSVLKVAGDWIFMPHKVDSQPRPSTGVLTFEFTAPK